jgi:tellurite methyltransferase
MKGYDKHYSTPDLFGDPYPELIEFFSKFEPKTNLLDLGCGQGRNSIPLARLGYKVTGIDSSKVGIEQMIKKSMSENLSATGIVGDIYNIDNYHDFNIILLDSMFHFLKKDLKRETELIVKILKEIKRGGLICICIRDAGQKVKILKKTVTKTKIGLEVLEDLTIMYHYEDKDSGHMSAMKYCLYIVRKE